MNLRASCANLNTLANLSSLGLLFCKNGQWGVVPHRVVVKAGGGITATPAGTWLSVCCRECWLQEELLGAQSQSSLAAGPQAHQGAGTQGHTHTQSSDSSGKKDAHSHSDCTEPGVALGDPSNSPFIPLVINPLQPPLSSWAPRIETKTEGSGWRRCAQRSGLGGVRRRGDWAWMG